MEPHKVPCEALVSRSMLPTALHLVAHEGDIFTTTSLKEEQ